MNHVIATSGGKDSLCMLLLLKEVNPEINYHVITTPTGNELPEMWDHFENLANLGIKCKRLYPIWSPSGGAQICGVFDGEDQIFASFTTGETPRGKKYKIVDKTWIDNSADCEIYKGDLLLKIIEKTKTIPNFRMRFCTRVLKIEPAQIYLYHHRPCIQYVGLRHDEPLREGLYGEILDVYQKYPLRDLGFSKEDVVNYLDSKNIKMPRRTDCALCFFQRLAEWKVLLEEYPELYQQGIDIEEKVGYTFRSPSRDTWHHELLELKKEFLSLTKKVRDYDKIKNQGQWINCDQEEICRICHGL